MDKLKIELLEYRKKNDKHPFHERCNVKSSNNCAMFLSISTIRLKDAYSRQKKREGT